MEPTFRGFAPILLLACLCAGAATVLADVPVAAPSLHVAAWLAFGAVALAAVLAPFPRVGAGRALLLTCSLAISLFAIDLFVKPPKVDGGADWRLEEIVDPRVEVRYRPNSSAPIIYPDNPRGYFEETPSALRDTWSLSLQRGNEAQLDHLAGDAMHVTISKLSSTDEWNVTLQQSGFSITRGDSYRLTFRARADAPKRISCELSLNRAPWMPLGEYHEVQLQPEWNNFECVFVATGSEPAARIMFNLARSKTPIEMRDVVLHNQTTGRDEAPALPPIQYVVNYRFNSLGFRGADYAVPRPANTFRIVALGDSFALGAGVHERDTFEAVLQNHLNREEASSGGRTKYEVINTGVSGYATRQELSSYKLFSSAYQPQLVLLVMVFNDDMSFQEEMRHGLFPSADNPGGLANLLAIGRAARRVRDYSDSMVALKELEGEVRQRGSRLAAVIFQNIPSPDRTWDALSAVVKNTLAGRDVPILNLQDALFAKSKDVDGYRVHAMDGHPNEVAHRIAAEQIERWLRDEHLLPEDWSHNRGRLTVDEAKGQ